MVHGVLCDLQVHLAVLQEFLFLQPQLIKFRMFSGAHLTPSGVVTGVRALFAKSFFQPKSSTFRVVGSLNSKFLQSIAWKCALFAFSFNACVVGGKEQNFGEEK